MGCMRLLNAMHCTAISSLELTVLLLFSSSDDSHCLPVSLFHAYLFFCSPLYIMAHPTPLHHPIPSPLIFLNPLHHYPPSSIHFSLVRPPAFCSPHPRTITTPPVNLPFLSHLDYIFPCCNLVFQSLPFFSTSSPCSFSFSNFFSFSS